MAGITKIGRTSEVVHSRLTLCNIGSRNLTVYGFKASILDVQEYILEHQELTP